MTISTGTASFKGIVGAMTFGIVTIASIEFTLLYIKLIIFAIAINHANDNLIYILISSALRNAQDTIIQSKKMRH